MGGMDSERPPLATVEAVREELKRLGYLDSSLDRFVLAGGESTSPLRASLGVALRVGLLGGALFGLAATLASVGLDRRLLAEPRDILVLGAYLAALLGLATALAALVGGLAAAWAGRRLGRRPRPSLARNIGIGLALGGLAYFALWWRSHLGAAPPAVHAIALALAVGLALVLGRFGWQAASATGCPSRACRGGTSSRSSPPPPSSWAAASPPPPGSGPTFPRTLRTSRSCPRACASECWPWTASSAA
jgi:hypothetical protein